MTGRWRSLHDPLDPPGTGSGIHTDGSMEGSCEGPGMGGCDEGSMEGSCEGPGVEGCDEGSMEGSCNLDGEGEASSCASVSIIAGRLSMDTAAPAPPRFPPALGRSPVCNERSDDESCR